MGTSNSKTITATKIIATTVHNSIVRHVSTEETNVVTTNLLNIQDSSDILIFNYNAHNELRSYMENLTNLKMTDELANSISNEVLSKLKSEESGLAGFVSTHENTLTSEMNMMMQDKKFVNTTKHVMMSAQGHIHTAILNSHDITLVNINMTNAVDSAIRSIDTAAQTSIYENNLHDTQKLMEESRKSGLGDTVGGMFGNLMSTVKSIGVSWIVGIVIVLVSFIWFIPAIVSGLGMGGSSAQPVTHGAAPPDNIITIAPRDKCGTI